METGTSSVKRNLLVCVRMKCRKGIARMIAGKREISWRSCVQSMRKEYADTDKKGREFDRAAAAAIRQNVNAFGEMSRICRFLLLMMREG